MYLENKVLKLRQAIMTYSLEQELKNCFLKTPAVQIYYPRITPDLIHQKYSTAQKDFSSKICFFPLTRNSSLSSESSPQTGCLSWSRKKAFLAWSHTFGSKIHRTRNVLPVFERTPRTKKASFCSCRANMQDLRLIFIPWP